MKRILLIVALLIPMTAWGFGLMMSSGTSPVAGGGPVFSETFTSGYDNADFLTNETVGAGNIIDQASTGSTGAGLKFEVSTKDNDNNTYATFTEQTGVTYFTFKFQMNLADWGTMYAQNGIIAMNDGGTEVGSSFTPCISWYARWNGASAIRWFVYNDTGVGASVNVTDTNWHTLSVKYISDGAGTTTFIYDGGAETTLAAEGSNCDPDTIAFGRLSGFATTSGPIFFDDIKVCASDDAATCGY